MRTLDLCCLKFDDTCQAHLRDCARNEDWTGFNDAATEAAHKIATKVDWLVLYHGTRLPNKSMIFENGLKVMTSDDLAAIVAPLWLRPKQEIKLALDKSLYFSGTLSRSVCTEPDRRVLFCPATSSFVKEGSEALRSIARCGERDLLLSWNPFVVVIKVPKENLEHQYVESALENYIKDIFSTEGNNAWPLTYCHNFYADVPKKFVLDVIEYKTFTTKYSPGIPLPCFDEH